MWGAVLVSPFFWPSCEVTTLWSYSLGYSPNYEVPSGSLRGLESGPRLKPTALSFGNINFFLCYFEVTPQSELSHGLRESVRSSGVCPVFYTEETFVNLRQFWHSQRVGPAGIGLFSSTENSSYFPRFPCVCPNKMPSSLALPYTESFSYPELHVLWTKKFKRIKTGGFGWVGGGRSKDHVSWCQRKFEIRVEFMYIGDDGI